MDSLSALLIVTNFFIFPLKLSTALVTITPSQSMSDGQTLESGDGTFELGFFGPGISRNRYLGIWYKNIPVRTVVWVANRHHPINDSSGVLRIDSTGNLVLVSKNTSVVWTTNSTKTAQSPIVQLLDYGNLVLREEKDGNSGIYLWQSFDYPSDTLLPEMKLGWDLKRGLEWRLSSWKSPDDPSPGDFTWRTQLQGIPEFVMWRGTKKYYRSGPWNGIGFSGAPDVRTNPIFEFNFVSNGDEAYYKYSLKNESGITMARIVMNQTTYHREPYTWNEATQAWMLYASVPRDYCDNYNLCGAYGNCITSSSPVCQCLQKFKPKSVGEWSSMNWTQGCERNKPLECQNGDGFIKYVGLKLPDGLHSWVNRTMNLEECRATCLRNCSCMAYTNLDIRGGGSGCVIWFGDLIDIRQVPTGGQELYIRMPSSEIVNSEETKPNSKTTMIAVIVTVVAVAMASGLLVVTYYICKKRTKNNWTNDQNNEDLELPLFKFATIASATDNFSSKNKLGEGGFGPVYMGTLPDGQEIAVKRLSSSSGQGLNEFKNEVILITRIQHRNLVKLLGCCFQKEEKMLVYEYMSNKSLDYFIFDQTRSKLLDWPKRFNIICGIARGLLYLHQDSRLRIIHRDLKASNVLLDNEMNPKISDFGMAKTFGGDQTEGNTNRVVGTYGYMAPEYAIDGLFSVKSDVFSFGILLLEIVSGKKSRALYNQSQSLIGCAWILWKEGRPLELIDALSRELCNLSQVMRCIHISLLCVQQHTEDRPDMASVVYMLGGEHPLPEPKEPGFFKERSTLETNDAPNNLESSSTNEITITLLEAR